MNKCIVFVSSNGTSRFRSFFCNLSFGVIEFAYFLSIFYLYSISYYIKEIKTFKLSKRGVASRSSYKRVGKVKIFERVIAIIVKYFLIPRSILIQLDVIDILNSYLVW